MPGIKYKVVNNSKICYAWKAEEYLGINLGTVIVFQNLGLKFGHYKNSAK